MQLLTFPLPLYALLVLFGIQAGNRQSLQKPIAALQAPSQLKCTQPQQLKILIFSNNDQTLKYFF